nr:MAG TPA: Ycf1 [Caudoviricetes sp.]
MARKGSMRAQRKRWAQWEAYHQRNDRFGGKEN